MEYAPFTGDLILAGGNQVVQINPLTNSIVSTLTLPTGHLFWADNGGDLLFIDYSTTGLIGSASNFVSDNFFQGSLDDFAPLVGAGAPPVPDPASMSLLAAGLAGMWSLRRRRGRTQR